MPGSRDSPLSPRQEAFRRSYVYFPNAASFRAARRPTGRHQRRGTGDDDKC